MPVSIDLRRGIDISGIILKTLHLYEKFFKRWIGLSNFKKISDDTKDGVKYFWPVSTIGLVKTPNAEKLL